jgi:hypothetical protein
MTTRFCLLGLHCWFIAASCDSTCLLAVFRLLLVTLLAGWLALLPAGGVFTGTAIPFAFGSMMVVLW